MGKRTGARRPFPQGAIAPAIALLALIAVAGAVWTRGRQAAGVATPAAAPTIDSRLILRPATVPFSAMIAGMDRVSGTVFPAYPGPNTIRLHLRHAPAVAAIAISAVMPGMSMTPARASLTGHGQEYSGVIALPMFGRYVATLTVQTANGPITGTTLLSLSLPHL